VPSQNKILRLTRKFRYSSNFDLYQAPAANWRDTISCVMAPQPPAPEELPVVCSFSNMTEEFMACDGWTGHGEDHKLYKVSWWSDLEGKCIHSSKIRFPEHGAVDLDSFESVFDYSFVKWQMKGHANLHTYRILLCSFDRICFSFFHKTVKIGRKDVM